MTDTQKELEKTLIEFIQKETKEPSTEKKYWNASADGLCTNWIMEIMKENHYQQVSTNLS